MNNLSAKQRRILDFLKDYTKKYGYAPSCRDICENCGISSTATAHGYLRRLEARGFIKRDGNRSRSMTFCDGFTDALHEEQVNVPVIGRVAAGLPILAVENFEGYVPLPQSFVRSDDVFILNVRGDSMVNAGILNGDQILARPQNTAENGEIVIALIGEEATCKRFYKEKDGVRLQPENPAYEPIYSKDVQILGKVVGLLRTY